MNTTHETPTGRQHIDELLPWYATGRLSAADAKQVADAIAVDAEVARRVDIARDEMHETVRANEQLGAPSARAIEQLFAKIDAEPKRVAAGAGLAGRLSAFLASLAPRTLAYAAVAGALALVVQAGVIGGLVLDRGGGTYETASFTKFESQDGSYVMVSFAEKATALEVLEFLRAQNAMIVDGPRAGGLFKLRVAPTKLDRAQLDDVVQRMRAQTGLVRLVAPTQ